MMAGGVAWLLAAQDGAGAWGGSPAAQASIEETALAVEALAAVLNSLRGGQSCPPRMPRTSVRGGQDCPPRGGSGYPPRFADSPTETMPRQQRPGHATLAEDPGIPLESVKAALARGTEWLIRRTGEGTQFPPAPIGFYFAKLWYYERLYPVIFTVAALERVRQIEGL
jgi:hypothetical protein